MAKAVARVDGNKYPTRLESCATREDCLRYRPHQPVRLFTQWQSAPPKWSAVLFVRRIRFAALPTQDFGLRAPPGSQFIELGRETRTAIAAHDDL